MSSATSCMLNDMGQKSQILVLICNDLPECVNGQNMGVIACFNHC